MKGQSRRREAPKILNDRRLFRGAAHDALDHELAPVLGRVQVKGAEIHPGVAIAHLQHSECEAEEEHDQHRCATQLVIEVISQPSKLRKGIYQGLSLSASNS